MEAGQEQLEHEFAVNVFGVIYMTQAVAGLGKMPQGGRIINIGSIASKVLVPEAPVYAATKAAADALTTLFAGEVRFSPPLMLLHTHLTRYFTAWKEPRHHR